MSSTNSNFNLYFDSDPISDRRDMGRHLAGIHAPKTRQLPRNGAWFLLLLCLDRIWRQKGDPKIKNRFKKNGKNQLNIDWTGRGGPVPDLWIGIDSYGWIGGIDRATAWWNFQSVSMATGKREPFTIPIEWQLWLTCSMIQIEGVAEEMGRG